MKVGQALVEGDQLTPENLASGVGTGERRPAAVRRHRARPLQRRSCRARHRHLGGDRRAGRRHQGHRDLARRSSACSPRPSSASTAPSPSPTKATRWSCCCSDPSPTRRGRDRGRRRPAGEVLRRPTRPTVRTFIDQRLPRRRRHRSPGEVARRRRRPAEDRQRSPPR